MDMVNEIIKLSQHALKVKKNKEKKKKKIRKSYFCKRMLRWRD
jgi:hypothetical protein